MKVPWPTEPLNFITNSSLVKDGVLSFSTTASDKICLPLCAFLAATNPANFATDSAVPAPLAAGMGVALSSGSAKRPGWYTKENMPVTTVNSEKCNSWKVE